MTSTGASSTSTSDDDQLRASSSPVERALKLQKERSDAASASYDERNKKFLAISSQNSAALHRRYLEDEERKRLEACQKKESYYHHTPLARNVPVASRKRRADMEDEWVKQHQHHPQRGAWPGMGMTPQMHHPYYPPQMLMAQNHQMNYGQCAPMPSTSTAVVAETSTSTTSSDPKQPSPPSTATAPLQSLVNMTNDPTQFASSATPPTTTSTVSKSNDDLCDLPTPGNVDFLASSEFRCDKEIADLGPDCLELGDTMATSAPATTAQHPTPSTSAAQCVKSPYAGGPNSVHSMHSAPQSNSNLHQPTTPGAATPGPPMYSSTPVTQPVTASQYAPQQQQQVPYGYPMMNEQQQAAFNHQQMAAAHQKSMQFRNYPSQAQQQEYHHYMMEMQRHRQWMMPPMGYGVPPTGPMGMHPGYPQQAAAGQANGQVYPHPMQQPYY